MKVRHSKSQSEIELQREVAILTAVEKVREKTMAIENSSELTEVVTELFRQVQFLGIEIQMFVLFIFKPNGGLEWWGTEFSDTGLPQCYDIPPLEEIADHPRANNLIKIREKKVPYQVFELSGEDKKSWDEFLLEKTGLKKLPDHIKNGMQTLNKILLCDAVCRHGILEVAGPVALSDKDSEILCRFAKVFEQTYTRFLDLKKAEAQAREAQIEAALERVRSRSMGIQKSEELGEVASMLYECMKSLGVSDFVNCGYVEIDERNDRQHCWMTRLDGSPVEKFYIPLVGDPIQDARYKKWKEQVNLFHQEVSGRQLADHLAYVTPTMGVEEAVEITMNEFPDPINFYCGFFRFGYLCIITGSKFSEAQEDLIVQFTKVFKQAYVRFMDLKKAEEQAREAEIQLALERIRARSMAMQSSEELREVIQVMYNQVSKLRIANRGCFLMIFDEARGNIQGWLSELAQAEFAKPFDFTHKDHEVICKWWDFWESDEERLSLHFKDREKFEFDTYLQENTGLRDLPEEVKAAIIKEPRVYFEYTNMDCGLMEFIDVEPFQEESIPVLKRITRVFEQAYTRFLDLQKAESQTREAQIEAAMERIRGSALAMHSSEELKDVIIELRRQIDSLGELDLEASVIHLYSENKSVFQSIAAVRPPGESGEIVLAHVHFPVDAMDQIKYMIEMYQSDVNEYTIEVDKEMAEEWQEVMVKHAPMIAERRVGFVNNRRLSDHSEYWNFADFSEGSLLLVTHSLASQDTKTVLRRTAAVFDIAYKRFRDLQKAEEQTREAQIEAALERVRSRSMGIQKSNELGEVAALLYEEMKKLGISDFITCGYQEVDEETQLQYCWMTRLDGSQQEKFKIPLKGDHILDERYKNWKSQVEFFYQKAADQELANHIAVVTPAVEVEEVVEITNKFPNPTYFHCANFEYGYLTLISGTKLPEEHANLFVRFTRVFKQAYIRFKDLRKAEKLALETARQSSLDRIRAEISSMRSAEDLNQITPIIWDELKTLEIPFIRCGVFIIDEENGVSHTYLSTPQGDSIAVLRLPLQGNPLTEKMTEAWKKQEIYTEHWDKEYFQEWTQYLINQGHIESKEQYEAGSTPESLDLHFIPFRQGMLYIGNTEPLSQDNLDLAHSMANSFSVAYDRYEDFKKLEEAFADLEAAQDQLVHAEKMASLGELTAGIAHEIQNPLNFVNNFSEINNELLEDLKVAITENDTEEIEVIFRNLQENESKVTHHGKRAENIVKSMLQHSRNSAGEKELTDINALCDEYIRLAYHGIRAREKSFNVGFRTDLDPDLPKVKAVSQDMGRVLLNLINNAFQVVAGAENPEVIISTKKLENGIEIRITDNGPGIPDEIKDKIFQPFFTTKPTGQGTGLGLSLAYDIVKAHGGELSVKSELGKGSTFTIELNQPTKS